MKLSIDFGYSMIKYVVFDDSQIIKKSFFSWGSGDISKHLEQIRSQYTDIQDICVTGGKSFLFGKQEDVELINELEATCKGALFLAGIQQGLVVNCGTGVSMTYFDGEKVSHMGGTGVGGGTVLGFAKLILDLEKFEDIEDLAKNGDLSKIDLQVQDIVGQGIGVLPGDITASNFAKLDDQKREDVALGIINLVAETVACVCIPVSEKIGTDSIIFAGGLVKSKLFMQNVEKVTKLFKKEIIIAQDSEFATAVGAGIL